MNYRRCFLDCNSYFNLPAVAVAAPWQEWSSIDKRQQEPKQTRQGWQLPSPHYDLMT
jgi:hypothetical protein